MPLFTHHPSVSWPPLSYPSSGRGASTTKPEVTIDEDPFAYFITPPPLADVDDTDEDALFEDWSAGITPQTRPRARSLSPFRRLQSHDTDGMVAPSPDSPTALIALRRWMHLSVPPTSPHAPRIQPQELSIDDVPPLSPLSTSPPMSPTTTETSARGRTDRRQIQRAHSNRPRVWMEPDELLWTVIEEGDDHDGDTQGGVVVVEADNGEEGWDPIVRLVEPRAEHESGKGGEQGGKRRCLLSVGTKRSGRPRRRLTKKMRLC